MREIKKTCERDRRGWNKEGKREEEKGRESEWGSVVNEGSIRKACPCSVLLRGIFIGCFVGGGSVVRSLFLLHACSCSVPLRGIFIEYHVL